jgi:hypothetical protein
MLRSRLTQIAALGVGAALLPVGKQIGILGDGVMSTAAAIAFRNAFMWALLYLGGRVIPGPQPMEAQSGDSFALMAARAPYAYGQKWDIAVLGSFGHNDGVMSTDPDNDATQLNAWKSAVDSWITNNPSALLIPICTTIGSTVGGESTASSFNGAITVAQRVNQLQKAYIATKTAGDSRVLLVDTFALYDPPNMSPSGDANKVHPDDRGGYALGFGAGGLGPTIGARIETKSRTQILDMLQAGTYPKLTPVRHLFFAAAPATDTTITLNGHTITFKNSGAVGQQVNTGGSAATTCTNLVTYINTNTASIGNATATTLSSGLNVLGLTTFAQTSATNAPVDLLAQPGTGGTLAGTVTPTGSYADQLTLTNNLTNGSGVGVTVAKVSQTGYEQQSIVVTGTPASQNTVAHTDTNNMQFTGSTPGNHYIVHAGLTIDDGAAGAPTGLHAWDFVMGTFGSMMASANNANNTGPSRKIDTVVHTVPLNIFGATIPAFGKRTQNQRWNATALTGRVLFERVITSRVSDRTRHQPLYIAADGILGSNNVLKPTGSVTQAAGGTIRVEPGTWGPFGLTETDFVERRIYKGTSSDTGVGTGTLIGTISGSTWTKTFIASDVSTGDKIWVEVDANNGVGSTVTARCAVANVVTAT